MEEIEAIAGAEGISVAEAMRQALAKYVETRTSDPEFQKRLEARLERDRKVLERLRVAGRGRVAAER